MPIISTLIKSPSKYAPNKNKENCFERKNLILDLMCAQNYIGEDECEKAKTLPVTLAEKEDIKGKTFIDMIESETENAIKNYPYLHKTLKVYTHLDKDLQKSVENTVFADGLSVDKTVVIIDNGGFVNAYFSTIGETERRLGSTIKPILVYAPAIETDTVYPCSIIKDEKTEIDGFTVNNFNDKYYGDVSVRFSLAKSLNSCAVKLLNGTGIKRSLSYAKKCGINLTENDENREQSAQSDMEKVVASVSALYTGGRLSEEDKDALARALMDAYWIAKGKQSK